MDRHEYTQRAREFCLRGNDLPQAKLNPATVREARTLHARALEARAYLQANYSVAGLAARYGISAGAMEKALNYSTWRHVK